MKLENEIKQSTFRSELQKAGINLLFTASHVNFEQVKIFKKHGLTGPQFNILRILRGQLPHVATINLLIERMIDKSSNASRIVEKLRIKNYIERIQCPDDRRAVNVKITDKGLEKLAELDLIEDEFFAGIKKLSQHELETLNLLLEKIRS
jgi:DNA-binding MarR family transcriptional regulator